MWWCFDPNTVDATPARIVYDLPGDSKRLLSDPVGVVRVLVNGTETIADGQPTHNLSGSLMRSGRDTANTDTRGRSNRPTNSCTDSPPCLPARASRAKPRRRLDSPCAKRSGN